MCSLIITITQRLDHPAIELVGQSKQHMGWGDATFYIHRRREYVHAHARRACERHRLTALFGPWQRWGRQ